MADLYRPGDHYLICDRTGFKIRASEARTEWTGAVVRKQSFEARHPQDFVRGRRDDPSVGREARAQAAARFMGPLTTTTTEAAVAGATALVVESVSRFADGDTITVPTDTGIFRTTVATTVLATLTINLDDPLPENVGSGMQVTNYSAVAEPNLG